MSGIQSYEEPFCIDLHSACRIGDLDKIKEAYNLDPTKLNAKDAGLGWAPLYRTVICGHYEGAEFLLRQGADPNITNGLGETPLHQAADNSQYNLAQLLLEYQASPNSQQNDGDSPLHHAAFRGDFKMLSLLLEHNGNPNIANFMFGRTPLHYAVDSSCCDCIRLLINQGADPNTKDKQGKSAFDLSSTQDVIEALNSTPVIDDPSEIIANSFNYPPSDLPNSPNATNFISDIGDDHPMFDTFGIDKLQKVMKNYQVKPIFNWLKEIGLEELYEILCEAGYDDSKAMVSQMLGPLPITEEDLEKGGVVKPGHRIRIIMKLEQDAGLVPRLKIKKNLEEGGLLHCCMIANNATRNLVTNSVSEMLESIDAGGCYQQFVDSGFDHYDSLILLVASNRCFNSRFLEDAVGVREPEWRKRIVKRLEKDLKKYHSATNSVNISFDEPKSVACDSCYVF